MLPGQSNLTPQGAVVVWRNGVMLVKGRIETLGSTLIYRTAPNYGP
jgi:hypothetical protein